MEKEIAPGKTKGYLRDNPFSSAFAELLRAGCCFSSPSAITQLTLPSKSSMNNSHNYWHANQNYRQRDHRVLNNANQPKFEQKLR